MILHNLLSAVKSFFGLQNDRPARTAQKRALYRYDLDVSDDDDSEYEPSPSKRRRHESVDIDTDSSSHTMANWVKPTPISFEKKYFFTPRQTNESEEIIPIVISDGSADECEVVDESPETSWGFKPLRNLSFQNESGRNAGRPESSNRVKATHKRKSFAAEAHMVQPYHTHLPSDRVAQRMKNGMEQPVMNGHDLQEKTISERCAHVCAIHSKQTGSRHRRKRVGSTAAECFRLEEKERYRQLLQQYSGAMTNPLFGSYGYNGQSSKSTSKPVFSSVLKGLHAPEVQILQSNPKRRSLGTPALVKEKLSETHQHYHTRSLLLKSRTSDDSLSSRHEPVHSSPEVEILERVSEIPSPISQRTRSRRKTDSPVNKVNTELTSKADDSVVITKEVIVPRWKQTLQSMNGFEYSSPDWLKEWKKKLVAEREEKQRQIEAAQQNAKTLEKSLETMVSKLHLSVTETIPEIIEEVFPLDEEEEEEVEPLPELTPEMEERIDDAFCPTPPDELLVQGFRLQIRRRDMETLQDLNWLNDEVINFYMNLLMERGKDDNMPSVYAVNTFFYPKLISGGHDALKRWTRKIDIFAHEIMLVPVHLGVHWCLAVVNFKDKTLMYYDSMGGNNNECLNALSDYLQAESLDKKKKPFDMTDWSIKNAKDIPQQMNSSDCGMFACKYAEYITRNAKITFKQEHMPYFRRRMVYEIITKRLL